jgi:hypothetical protein
VKALSGRQPWWWAILHAGKRIENRRWNTTYRGTILLHAAKGCTTKEYVEALRWMLDAGVLESTLGVPSLNDMLRGGIVGRARIIDVVAPRPPMIPTDGWYPNVDHRWHMREQYGFVLSDVEPLPFVSCKGALGLFELDLKRPERSAP